MLAFKVRIGELSSLEVEGHHGFQNRGEHTDGDMFADALLGVVGDRSAPLELDQHLALGVLQGGGVLQQRPAGAL